ncbi:peptidylprolyl isomerase [Dactylosporangium cerinum]
MHPAAASTVVALVAEAAELRRQLAADLATRAVFARLATTCGSLRFELFPRRAPQAVANFVGLANGVLPYVDSATGERRTGRYFDGFCIGRIVRGMLLDFTPAADLHGPGYTFDDEYAADLTFNRPYLVAMANDGKRSDGSGTNGSQFFVTLSPAAHLNFTKPIFGELADDHSRRLVDELSLTLVDGQGRPVEPVVVEHVEITLDYRTER